MVNSKLRRHKVMEKVIKKLMAGNLPPRFKFKDTYASIDVPQEYQQYLPTQQQLETEFNEMIAEEEELPTVDAAVDDVKVISSNLYVHSNTGNVGIGTASPGYTLDVTGSANVGALAATSLNVSGPTNTVNLGLTHSLANRTTDTVFYSSDGNYIYKNTATGLRTALDVPSASAAVFTGNVGVGTTNPGFSLDVHGTANVGALTTTSVSIKDDPHSELNFNFTNSKWLQQQKLTAGADAGPSDYFGYSASISSDGSTAIVGAYLDDDNGQSNSGSAYIFVRSGSSWTQQAKLTAGADAGANDYFGYSASISSDGSTAIVGAYLDDDNGQSSSGSAYIFVRSGSSWTQQAKLTAGTDAGYGDQFGEKVSISGDGNTAIVGAVFDDDNGQSGSGSAYIFVRSGSSWTQQAKLTAGTDAARNDYFGQSVSISWNGNTAIVGADYDDDNGQYDSGSAYIFVRSGSSWTQQAKLTAGADAGAYDYFGQSVSISWDGSTAIVGAYYDDDNGQSNSGSAYIFVRSGSSWTQQAKLTAGADAGSSDFFGWSVSISGDGSTAIVGAYKDDDNGQSDSGSAYIFVRSGSSWRQKNKLTANGDAGANDWFGRSVSISSDGSTAIVGAYKDDDNGQSDSGSAYIFNAERALHISKHIDVDGSAYIEKDVIIDEVHKFPLMPVHGVIGREDLYTWEGSTNTIVNTLNQQNEPFYYNSDSSFKRLQTGGSATYSTNFYTTKWNGSYMINTGNLSQDNDGNLASPTNYAQISLPVQYINGKTCSHALFLKFITHDRWSLACAYVTNSDGSQVYRLQASGNSERNGTGDNGISSWIGPNGDMSMSHQLHEWQMFSIPEYIVESYSYSETRDNKSKYNRNIIVRFCYATGNTNGGTLYWSGIAMRANPYGLTVHKAITLHYASNGGNAIDWYSDSWNGEAMTTVENNRNYTSIYVPICPPKDPSVHGYPDFYLGYIGHRSDLIYERKPKIYLQSSNGTYKYLGRPAIQYQGRFGHFTSSYRGSTRSGGFGVYVPSPSSEYIVMVQGRPYLRIRIDNTNDGWGTHRSHQKGLYTEVVYRDGSKDGLGDNGQHYI